MKRAYPILAAAVEKKRKLRKEETADILTWCLHLLAKRKEEQRRW